MKSFPFAAGLLTKTDPRELNIPALDIALNVNFDSLGAIETRLPFAALGTNIYGGGTIANPRRLVANKGELVLFTDTGVYSWLPSESAWALRGTHLAAAVTETDRFASQGTTYTQDRAELNGVIVSTWTNPITGVGTNVYVGATDKVTGAILLSPTVVNDSASAVGARLIALATRVLLIYGGSGGLSVVAIDPANLPAFATATPTVITFSGGGGGGEYDVARVGATDTATIVSTTGGFASYGIATITSALSMSSATKARASSRIGVAVHPDGLHVQVCREDGAGNIKGDYITIAGFADVNINQAIDSGTPSAPHLAMAYRSVQNSGHYRCYVFWCAGTIGGTIGGAVWSNWVDDANNLGTSAALLPHALLNVASRAFDYKGSVYVWTIFTENSTFSGGNAGGFRAQLQNTYFLYRDDGTLHSKAVDDIAGGIPNLGFLPSVVNTSGSTFAFMGVHLNKIPLNTNQTSYASTWCPREVVFTFDSNDARRCARLGNTLYVSGGGEMLQYDGVGVYEVGFETYPWSFAVVDHAAGALAAAVYAYKMTWKWQNATGEIERSTTATVATVSMAASRRSEIASFGPLAITRKTYPTPDAEVWRTTQTPAASSPFFLVTSTDQTNTTNPNRGLPSNASNVFDDNLTDAQIQSRQNDVISGGQLLENLAPPGASIIAANDTRLFIAGIPGQPDTVWYSKQRANGEIAAFNDALTFNVPAMGGNITGLAFLNETLVVFRERSIFVVPGDGFDNAGGGANYGPAKLISADVGSENPDAIALTPLGLVFSSSKGWFLLDRGWNVQYIGAAVSKYDDDTILAVHTVESRHQVRVVTNNRVLIYDYLVEGDPVPGARIGQWAEWAIPTAVHACSWNGTYYYLDSTLGAMQEQSTWTNLTYGIDVETAWIKPAEDMQGRAIVDFFQVLGEFRSSCNLRIRVAYDYQSDGAGGWAYVDDVGQSKPVTPTVVGGPLQIRHGLKKKRCQAFKVRLTTYGNDGISAPTGEGCRLTGIAYKFAVEPGVYSGIPAGQRT
jgi:hypothetical protein